MRIWLNSFDSIGTNPLLDPYYESLRKHVQEVGRPDTTVDVHGVDVSLSERNADSEYLGLFNKLQLVNNALRAEKEGYDAFACACMMDPAFTELREVLNIPVAFSRESAVYLACLMTYKFAFLSEHDILYLRHVEAVRQMVSPDRIAHVSCFDVPLAGLVAGFADPEPLLKGARKIAKEAIEQGADVLIPCGGIFSQVLVFHGIKEIEGLRVIDTIGTVIRMAEFLVDLKKWGVERIPWGPYIHNVSKKQLAVMQEMYKSATLIP